MSQIEMEGLGWGDCAVCGGPVSRRGYAIGPGGHPVAVEPPRMGLDRGALGEPWCVDCEWAAPPETRAKYDAHYGLPVA